MANLTDAELDAMEHRFKALATRTASITRGMSDDTAAGYRRSCAGHAGLELIAEVRRLREEHVKLGRIAECARMMVVTAGRAATRHSAEEYDLWATAFLYGLRDYGDNSGWRDAGFREWWDTASRAPVALDEDDAPPVDSETFCRDIVVVKNAMTPDGKRHAERIEAYVDSLVAELAAVRAERDRLEAAYGLTTGAQHGNG